MQQLAEAAKRTRAWACYDCGKCTSTCPVARAGGHFSPRRNVLAANQNQAQALLDDGGLYVCLSCGACDQRCPAEVRFTDLVKELRVYAHGEGYEPDCPHGGALQSLMRMMARGGTEQDRRGWLEEAGLNGNKQRSSVFYWVGCAVYYDDMFKDYGVQTLNGSRAAVGLINQLGTNPVVSGEERCCGHDLLWNGDVEHFEMLARHNVKVIERSGAEVLVTSCAECLRTLRMDYEPFWEEEPPRMLHITEYLAEQLGELGLGEGDTEQDGSRAVTYQDPCRLGRHLGIYDAPRQVMEALPGVELKEMGRNRTGAVCCAGSTWSNCDRYAKKIQVDRLKEARATGAEVLVTSCPKCQIHLSCAMNDPNLEDEIRIEMRDVAELVAAARS